MMRERWKPRPKPGYLAAHAQLYGESDPMSDYVYAAHKDSNHDEIVKAYEELFCSVLDLHKVGGGCPDILVGCAGIDQLVEIKPVGDEPRANQVLFATTWRGRKVRIISTRAQVLEHVNEMRRKQGSL